jgi:hypothetical protein
MAAFPQYSVEDVPTDIMYVSAPALEQCSQNLLGAHFAS